MRDQKEIEEIERVHSALSQNAKRVLHVVVELEKENLHLEPRQAARAVIEQMLRRIEGIG